MCDFGVSEMFAKKGEDKVKKGSGSPAFMSPESIDGGSEIEAKPADGQSALLSLSLEVPFTDTIVLSLLSCS
jgi:serine/threonine protein kinase